LDIAIRDEISTLAIGKGSKEGQIKRLTDKAGNEQKQVSTPRGVAVLKWYPEANGNQLIMVLANFTKEHIERAIIILTGNAKRSFLSLRRRAGWRIYTMAR
jgi:hypothetical protein